VSKQTAREERIMYAFQDKVVLVTGATAGIGRATAEAFATAGARLALTGRNVAAGEDLASALRGRGAKVKFLAGDVAQEHIVRAWIAATLQEFGRLDVAVNNAGVEGALGAVTEQTAENFAHVFDVNVKGLMFSMKHEIPAIARPGGSIINVSSMVGEVALPGASVYVASKHAVNGLTRSAVLETAQSGVRINAIAPGGVITPMYERFTGGNEQVQEGFAASHPLRRLAQPEEIARAILFLASEEARFMTGAVLNVDGGYTAQ
jgi:NAD(P)-dependent dehydrogenase (short-subunit alcohol dehydrogenase family)